MLDRRDIFQCELVCRNWKSPAQRANYTSLTLGGHDTQKLIKAFENNQDSPGKFVKKLLPVRSNNIPWEQYLPTMVDIFPFIDTLEVHEPNEDFYSALITIRNKSKWKCLKNFELPNLDQDLEMYATCALKYRTSLENLLICDKIQFIHSNGGDIHNELYFTLLEELEQFPKVEELTIKRHTNNCLESFDKIIEKCQKLKKLDIGIYPEFDHKITTTDIDLSLIRPRPNIKTLDGLFVIQDDSTLLYIMHKFPQLQDLFINHSWRDDTTENDGLNTLASSITTATLTKFTSYITSVSSCAVSIYIKMSHIVDVLDEYSRVMPGKLFSFLSIGYAYDSLIDPLMEQNAKLTMHRITGFKKNQDHEFFIDYNSIADTLPHLNVIEKIGNSLAELTYRMNFDHIPKETSRKAYNMIYGYFLDHIFSNCSNLIKLRLSSTNLHNCNPILCQNSSMTHLILLNCYIGKDMLSQLSKRLVSLKNMVIVRCRLENPYNGVNTRYFHIDMCNSTFDSIRIKSEYTISIITVKLNRGKHDEYYKLLLDSGTHSHYVAESSTILEYKLMPNNERSMKVYIRCSSIKKIQLFTNTSVDVGKVVFGEIVPL